MPEECCATDSTPQLGAPVQRARVSKGCSPTTAARLLSRVVPARRKGVEERQRLAPAPGADVRRHRHRQRPQLLARREVAEAKLRGQQLRGRGGSPTGVGAQVGVVLGAGVEQLVGGRHAAADLSGRSRVPQCFGA